MNRILTTIALLIVTTQANANLHLEFREGAPKDRFILSNVGDCTLKNLAVTIDFKNSNGKLIFDVTGDGAGVEVFQPFEIESGAKFLAQRPTVLDGQTAVTLELPAFAAGKKLVVSTDVDDTIGEREITVKSSEFAGTVVSVSVDGKVSTAVFGQSPATTVKLDGC